MEKVTKKKREYLYDVIKKLGGIYAEFIEYTDEGTPTCFGNTQDLKFDLKEKNIWVDEYYYILYHGKLVRTEISLTTGETFYINGFTLIDPDLVEGDPYAMIEDLFYDYYHSMPSTRERQKNHYFKFKPTEQVGLKEMELNLSRVETRYALEGFIVLAASAGLIPWENDKHFFWRSTKEPDLILYKSWVA